MLWLWVWFLGSAATNHIPCSYKPFNYCHSLADSSDLLPCWFPNLMFFLLSSDSVWTFFCLFVFLLLRSTILPPSRLRSGNLHTKLKSYYNFLWKLEWKRFFKKPLSIIVKASDSVCKALTLSMQTAQGHGAEVSFQLQEALKILSRCAHAPGCQLKHSFHGICENTQIIFFYYTWGCVSAILMMHMNSLPQTFNSASRQTNADYVLFRQSHVVKLQQR